MSRTSSLACLGLVYVTLAALAAVGCGGDDTRCGAGTVEEAGACVPICAAGTHPDGTGACVPDDQPFDRRACVGRFGPTPEGMAGVVYVDAAYTGSDADGSSARPFRDGAAALPAAADGATIALARGTYPGFTSVTRPVAIEGRCARDVVLTGPVAVDGAAPVAIRGVTIRGGAPGLTVRGAAAAPGVTVELVRIEDAQGTGLYVDGSVVAFRYGQITGTGRTSDAMLGQTGAGVFVAGGANLTLLLSRIDDNDGDGIQIEDATGAIAAPTQASPSLVSIDMMGIVGNRGHGISIHSVAQTPAGVEALTIDSNTISNNQGFGVVVEFAVVVMNFNVVTANSQGASMMAPARPGRPIGIELDIPAGAALGEATIDFIGNQFIDNVGYGSRVYDVEGTFAGNQVIGADGPGLVVEAVGDGRTLVVAGNHLKDGGTPGIWALPGAVASTGRLVVTGNTIEGAGTLPSGGLPVAGILIERAGQGGVEVSDNVVDGARHAGIVVTDTGNVKVLRNRVTGTVADAGAGPTTSGHGICVTGSRAQVDDNVVEDSAGAGIHLGTVPFFTVSGNQVRRNKVGLSVQGVSTGDLIGNLAEDNQGFGIRVKDVQPAQIHLAGNASRRTTALSTMPDADGDGYMVWNSPVIMDLGMGTALNRAEDSARVGMYFFGISACSVQDCSSTGSGSTCDHMDETIPSVSWLGNNTGSMCNGATRTFDNDVPDISCPVGM